MRRRNLQFNGLKIAELSRFINVHWKLNSVGSMGEIRGAVSKETEEKFRRTAMKKFGYRKGSLSKALETALCQWIQTSDLEDSTERAN